MFSSPEAGQPWGTFTTDVEGGHSDSSLSAKKVSCVGGSWDTLLIACLRPDVLETASVNVSKSHLQSFRASCPNEDGMLEELDELEGPLEKPFGIASMEQLIFPYVLKFYTVIKAFNPCYLGN